MKKFFLLILSFVYLATSSGATVYIHQCMGKMIAWELLENEGSSCTKCGMHKNAPTDCCKDHVKVLKVQNDQSLPNANHAKVIGQSAILPASINFSSPALIGNAHQSDAYYLPPPRSSKISYCILYCNFLI
ncbi:MAG: hypothetical protein ABJA32_03475 [Ginsengibacter sp.]